VIAARAHIILDEIVSLAKTYLQWKFRGHHRSHGF